MNDSRFEGLVVVTGGPGAGKTTLVEALRRAGHAVSAEAGRAIIQEQVAISGPGLPWLDPPLFAELMLSWEVRSYRAALERTGTVYFDHAVPCVAGYHRLLGRPVPAHVDAAVAAYPYRRQVFVTPPWPEIYRTDAERRQTLDEACRTHDALVEAYTAYGYELVEIPRASVADRLRFVLHHTAGTDRTAPSG